MVGCLHCNLVNVVYVQVGVDSFLDLQLVIDFPFDAGVVVDAFSKRFNFKVLYEHSGILVLEIYLNDGKQEHD